MQDAADLLSTLDSSVKREIYGHRVAEAAGISDDAMKLEINKAFKRRLAMQKKAQEKIDLAPVQAMRPKERSIRYDNMKSAMAEELILAQALKEPALLDNVGMLTGDKFSVPVLGKVFAQFQTRHAIHLDVSLSVLEDLSPEEMSHLVSITQKHDGPVNETAFRDCIRTVLSQQKKQIDNDDDLLALQNKLKASKGK